VPLNFELKLNETKYAKEVTEFQRKYNAVVDSINGDTTIQNKLSFFVKKTCQKVETIKECILVDKKKCVPEKKLSQFYSECHQYSISLHFKLNCVELFESEFCDVHQTVCYKNFEQIRKIYIQEQANTFQTENPKLQKRTITDPSKARIRYVAGYCVAKVKNHFFKQKTTNAYKDDGFNSYESAKYSLSVIRQLTEDEIETKQPTPRLSY